MRTVGGEDVRKREREERRKGVGGEDLRRRR